MTVIVCVDERLGRTFLGKRQSRDALLCEDVLSLVGSSRLFLSPYSAPLFEGAAVSISENYLAEATRGDFCFCEREALSPYLGKISRLVLYRWNRLYPSDTVLDVLPEACGMTRVSSHEFVGKSHETITREVFET